ncbi:flavin reductase family protein [Nocardioides sp. Kera G14]|uniref:flavin reductase family protein n=1 Tax=Nocardioides sp. Kera G14 TaxID=2884264 RepID=UPI001D128C7F|nr:flavin reductase family protein [Nocardioides sp. Kera G14]UDY22966.1 flavin reductase family protein [Nocardioides sp. Kera G14]
MRALTTEEFDPFIEGLDYPVFVVTASSGEEADGCLVGFATQASIDPPRLLVCLSVANRTFRVAQGTEFLAVHVLAADQHGLAEHFGGETGDEVDKLAGVPWHPGPDGVPLLDDLPRYVVGRVLSRTPFGDHVGHLLEPVSESVDSSEQALTLQDADDITAGHPA